MATKFTCFAQFPKELRDRIWELALPDLSFMEVKMQCDEPNQPTQFSTACKEHEKEITGVARASKDSRAVALRIFPAFLPTGRESIEIRFHPNKTLLQISFLTTDWVQLYHPYLSNIRHLAIASIYLTELCWCCELDLSDFLNLERLVIIKSKTVFQEGIVSTREAAEVPIKKIVDELKAMYDEEMLTMPKIELWERDEEGDGSTKYKEDITPR